MRAGLVALALACGASPVAAQRPADDPAGRFDSPPGSGAPLRFPSPAPPLPTAPPSPLADALRTPGGAFAASLLAPGSGQAALGLRRWPVYVALEVGLWWLWADARGDFRGYRDDYRDLAWEAARVQVEPRVDGGWSYYEAMSHYLASGAFDADPAAGLQPEEDGSTYNGAVWEVARGIHLPGGVADPASPEYAAALAWYEDRAAGEAFLWSWAGQDAELALFRGLIGSADDARRTQTTALGVILANHLVSAIDAFIAARLRSSGRPELESGLVPGPAGATWSLRLRLPLDQTK